MANMTAIKAAARNKKVFFIFKSPFLFEVNCMAEMHHYVKIPELLLWIVNIGIDAFAVWAAVRYSPRFRWLGVFLAYSLATDCVTLYLARFSHSTAHQYFWAYSVIEIAAKFLLAFAIMELLGHILPRFRSIAEIWAPGLVVGMVFLLLASGLANTLSLMLLMAHTMLLLCLLAVLMGVGIRGIHNGHTDNLCAAIGLLILGMLTCAMWEEKTGWSYTVSRCTMAVWGLGILNIARVLMAAPVTSKWITAKHRRNRVPDHRDRQADAHNDASFSRL